MSLASSFDKRDWRCVLQRSARTNSFSLAISLGETKKDLSHLVLKSHILDKLHQKRLKRAFSRPNLHLLRSGVCSKGGDCTISPSETFDENSK